MTAQGGDVLAAWPGDSTATGYVPRIGQHVFCYRPADGASRCGVVVDNRAGLFHASCHRGRIVLTAARWNVQPVALTSSCRTEGTQNSPRERDQVT